MFIPMVTVMSRDAQLSASIFKIHICPNVNTVTVKSLLVKFLRVFEAK
jgi:hypothetical protein